MILTSPAVAEVQGLYGPFSFSEKLFQKIWLRGDFDRTRAATIDGRRVEVLHPGKWNLLGGPDFRGARLRFDGAEVTGEVELHLRAADWAAHAHASDPAYDGVILHVVLFPPETGHVTRGADHRPIPVLALLPLLLHDLEEFAAEEAVEALAGRSVARIPDELAILRETELAALLATHAGARWRQKVHFARRRIARLGWESACHHTALEILGFRFNRAPMLQVATRWPLTDWVAAAVEPETVLTALDSAWSLQGVRPANQPRTRLRQYRDWTHARPDWPAQLLALAHSLTALSVSPPIAPTASTREIRRLHCFTALRARIAAELCADVLGGTRLDTLICDGLLPLLAAHDDDGPRAAVWPGLWHHWFAGDLPILIERGLRELGVFTGPARPAAHGPAQGLLGWLIEHEDRR